MNAPLVLFGLGSNLGDREAALREAVEKLKSHPGVALKEVRCSQFYEFPALLPPGAPAEWNRPYLNAVCAGHSDAAPEALLAAAKEIEVAMGRAPRGHWAPREIDIDILAYGERVVASETLILPHKEMLKREFVLHPLAEILPDWKYPGEGEAKGKTVRELMPNED